MTATERQSADHGAAPGASDRMTPLMWVAAAVSAISSLLYGYDTGIISGALLQIRRDFDTTSFVEQLVAGSILFGAVIGTFSTIYVSAPMLIWLGVGPDSFVPSDTAGDAERVAARMP